MRLRTALEEAFPAYCRTVPPAAPFSGAQRSNMGTELSTACPHGIHVSSGIVAVGFPICGLSPFVGFSPALNSLIGTRLSRGHICVTK
jgi:hypothetical protein